MKEHYGLSGTATFKNTKESKRAVKQLLESFDSAGSGSDILDETPDSFAVEFSYGQIIRAEEADELEDKLKNIGERYVIDVGRLTATWGFSEKTLYLGSKEAVTAAKNEDALQTLQEKLLPMLSPEGVSMAVAILTGELVTRLHNARSQ